MKKVWETLLSHCGSYYAKGVESGGAEFHGLLQLEPILEDKAVRLEFSARGLDGKLHYAEQGFVSMNPHNVVCVDLLSTICTQLQNFHCISEDDAIFICNDDATKKLSFHILPNGQLAYSPAWDQLEQALQMGMIEEFADITNIASAAREASAGSNASSVLSS